MLAQVSEVTLQEPLFCHMILLWYKGLIVHNALQLYSVLCQTVSQHVSHLPPVRTTELFVQLSRNRLVAWYTNFTPAYKQALYQRNNTQVRLYRKLKDRRKIIEGKKSNNAFVFIVHILWYLLLFLVYLLAMSWTDRSQHSRHILVLSCLSAIPADDSSRV